MDICSDWSPGIDPEHIWKQFSVSRTPAGSYFFKNKNTFSTVWTWSFREILTFPQVLLFFPQNGSPSQTTLLDRFGSKFCVEPRYQNPDISHMSQNPIWKLPKHFPRVYHPIVWGDRHFGRIIIPETVHHPTLLASMCVVPLATRTQV